MVTQEMTESEKILAYGREQRDTLEDKDLKSAFDFLIKNTKGLEGGLHNEISDSLRKAFEDPRPLTQQIHEEVGDLVEWCVNFDQPWNKGKF